MIANTGYLRAAMAGLVLFGSVGSVCAQDPSPAAVATARKVIEAKGVDRLYDPVLTGMIIRARDTFLRTNPHLNNELTSVAQKMRRDYEPKLDELKTQVAKIYASRFTEQELKDILAFYTSPLGSKVVAAEPKILEQSMGYADRWARDLGEKILNAMRSEMIKRGHDL